jgi:hypothetical protein
VSNLPSQSTSTTCSASTSNQCFIKVVYLKLLLLRGLERAVHERRMVTTPKSGPHPSTGMLNSSCEKSIGPCSIPSS